jgi:hypothetical protein
MKTGMLWFDNDPNTDLSSKVRRAANYYSNKHGKAPTLCFVALNFKNPPATVDGITIKANRAIPTNNLWIGQD